MPFLWYSGILNSFDMVKNVLMVLIRYSFTSALFWILFAWGLDHVQFDVICYENMFFACLLQHFFTKRAHNFHTYLKHVNLFHQKKSDQTDGNVYLKSGTNKNLTILDSSILLTLKSLINEHARLAFLIFFYFQFFI